MRDDSTAEELAVYSFRLTGATTAALDPSQSTLEATVTVVASDDPFGIIEFQSPPKLNVSEDVGFVNLTVVRDGGSIGALSVNYSVSSDTATEGQDYESFGSGRFLFPLLRFILRNIFQKRRAPFGLSLLESWSVKFLGGVFTELKLS